nr:hypothetical protein [Sedimentibacter sp.]
MLNKNIIKVLTLSTCLTLSTMTAAFAQTLELPPDTAVVNISAVDEALYEKQAGFDKILFEEKVKEIEEKGITVTHTSPADGYIEVGITPFNEENQNYIIEILGSDEVKVVEGIMAVTYTDELKNTTSVVGLEPVIAPDAATSGFYEGNIAESQIVSTPEEATDAKTISVQENAKVKDDVKNISPIAIVLGVVALLGLGTVFFKKKTA